MGKIGFVLISHKDYLDDTVRDFTRKACDEVKRTGHTVFESGCIITDHRCVPCLPLSMLADEGVVTYGDASARIEALANIMGIETIRI